MRYLICSLGLLMSLWICAQPSTPGTVCATGSATDGYYPRVVVPRLPQTLDLAGEQVPLDNYDTRESLMREMTNILYTHSRTMQSLLATTRIFPLVEPILKQYGVPDDFKYLCMAESGLNPNVSSGAGAAGLWQLMKTYAKSQNLFMGEGVDERYDIEKSTQAACSYLVDAKQRLGSWTLAAASFNAGVAGVSRRLQKQGVSSYYDLYMPEETMRYVFRVLAFKLIASDPAAYGYAIPSDAYNPPLGSYREVSVNDASIDWAAVARNNGTTYKMLRELNHWIRDYDYDNKEQHTFVVKIPEGNFRK